MVIPSNNIPSSTQQGSTQSASGSKNNANTDATGANRASTQGISRPAGPPPLSGGQNPQGQTSSDNVSLSSQGLSIANLESAIEDAPDIDQAKVDEIKNSIDAGTYKPDADKIAFAILAQEDLL